jgi:hypothetical protein
MPDEAIISAAARSDEVPMPMFGALIGRTGSRSGAGELSGAQWRCSRARRMATIRTAS